MRGSARKDAAKVVILMVLVCIIFRFVLLPMYEQQPEIKKELPAATGQLTSCETRNIS